MLGRSSGFHSQLLFAIKVQLINLLRICCQFGFHDFHLDVFFDFGVEDAPFPFEEYFQHSKGPIPLFDFGVLYSNGDETAKDNPILIDFLAKISNFDIGVILLECEHFCQFLAIGFAHADFSTLQQSHFLNKFDKSLLIFFCPDVALDFQYFLNFRLF